MTARLAPAALLAAALLTLPAAPAQAAGPTVHRLRAGVTPQAVQAVLDAARPGDTVELPAGTVPGGLTVSVDRLTLRGQGPARTVLRPDAGATGACAAAGHGLCVTGLPGSPVHGVRIEALAVEGFTKDGLHASQTDALTVRAVAARANGQQGVSTDASTGSLLTAVQASGNGQAGIFVANSVDHEGGALDTGGSEVSGNRLTGNRIGVVLRRVRNITVEANLIGDNCGGVFVVGDEGVPRAGALTVRDNTVDANNRYCAPNPRLDFIQGTGILLTGTEDTVVTGNRVTGNTGASPMSGGIVLFHSLVGAPNSGATVTGNLLSGNGPADLADRDTGSGNLLDGNACRTSLPAGHC
ncbi:right-handed parallel beta-helix repeat-containing protein [Kitasatospora sp. NPDC048365]|uniref:right-handed parallel beta-helix repeat-containing protein n=1 Tax=Kitasatospora sp. NPDC048365 TaxID=3364050 RepID=UPI003719FAC9